MTDQNHKALAAIIRQVVLQVITTLHIPRVVWGQVTNVLAAPPLPSNITVQPQGTLEFGSSLIYGVRYFPWYSPMIGDTVVGFAVGRDFWVLGALQP